MKKRNERRRPINLSGLQMASFVALLLVALCAIFAPLIAPQSPLQQHLSSVLQGPTAKYYLGTDQLGRDVLSRVIFGARSSLVVGFSSIFLAFVVGVPLGCLAGFYGGIGDNVIMRIMDIILSFPGLVFAVAVTAILGSSATGVIFVIAFVTMAQFARVARSTVLSEKEEEYVTAQRSIGASGLHILFQDIFPNALSPLIAQFTFLVAFAIFLEASLGFLGLGVPPPTPSWGNMMSSGRQYLYAGKWWLTVFPGVAVFVTVFSLNIIGDFVRDFMDPRTRKRSGRNK